MTCQYGHFSQSQAIVFNLALLLALIYYSSFFLICQKEPIPAVLVFNGRSYVVRVNLGSTEPLKLFRRISFSDLFHTNIRQSGQLSCSCRRIILYRFSKAQAVRFIRAMFMKNGYIMLYLACSFANTSSELVALL